MNIQISKLAAYKTRKLLDYLESEWSKSAKNRFVQKMAASFEALKQNPEGFPQSEIRPELRRMVITKQTSVLYTFQKATIFIVTLFDNRQDSQKIEAEIEKFFG